MPNLENVSAVIFDPLDNNKDYFAEEVLPSMLYWAISPIYEIPVVDDKILAFHPLLPKQVLLNIHALNRLREFSTPRTLDGDADYAMAKSGILTTFPKRLEPIEVEQKVLTAWMHVTNACNLACPYCMINKSKSHMSEEAGLNAIKSSFEAAKNNGFETVHIKYAGGEPTLRFDFLQYLHKNAEEIAYYSGIKLQAGILSNGTIWTPEMADWLLYTGVGLAISLDGIGDAHDKQRSAKNGKGSFSKIEHNVDQILLARGVYPSITITVTASNADSIGDVVKWALERELTFKLNFYRENQASSKYDEYKLEEARIIDGIRNAYRIIENNLPTTPFLEGLLDLVQFKAHKHTCTAGNSYLVFTHTGQVAQCPLNMEESLKYSQQTSPLQVIRSGRIPVINVNNKEGCKNCEWRYYCAGGCPLETYRSTGRYDVKSPHCNIYKTLIPEALRLEGLRLMKAANICDNYKINADYQRLSFTLSGPCGQHR